MAEAHDRSSGWIGAVLADKWHVDAKIARGGVATVYRATHRQGQVAAIKIMHPELARNEEVRKRFLREGYAANKVGHPGVVSVLDDDVTKDGTAYIVMELLEQGEVLEDRRERLGGKLPIAEAVDVCDQILDVLAMAHEKGIIHRDIKPENVFVLSDGVVKVLDFGIAHIKEAAKAQEATATGLLLGTPEYMSPEQVLGKRGQIDASTDIYAVGATLFTLLSGESVHVADTLNMLLVQAASRQARSLASVAYKHLPRPLIAVVDKALALEKPRRWPSARAMQLALRAAVPGAKASSQKAAASPPSSAAPDTVPNPAAPVKTESASKAQGAPKPQAASKAEGSPAVVPSAAKLSAPPPRPASLPPPRPASLPPPRPASLPPRPASLPPPRPGSLRPAPPRPPSLSPPAPPPPSLPPLSGPTTVIPRREETDPWTDEMGADDLDGPTVATTGGPSGGSPAPSVRSEVLARPPMPSAPPSRPRPPSVRKPAPLESTQLLRTDERMALAQAQTVMDPTTSPVPRASAWPPAPAEARLGATHPYLPAPPPRDASGRSIAPPAVPTPSSAPSVPPPWMAPRGHTMPMINDTSPQPPARREPLAPAVVIAIAVAALLLSAIWIGSCLLLQSN